MQKAGTKYKTCFSIYNTGFAIPVTIIQGCKTGKQITLSAGIHSREYVGIQALSELAKELQPEEIAGTVLILHCCNYDGFLRRSADVFPQDGKNLNQIFPGCADGTVTEQVAAFLEESVIQNSDYIVDLHSGGFCEALTPHVYFQGTAQKEVCRISEQIARLTSVPYIVQSNAENGFYSWAGQRGVPAVIIERGGCGLLDRHEVEKDIADVRNILRGLGFLRDGIPTAHFPKHLIQTAYYENAPCHGCWHPQKNPGDMVSKDELLGEIRDIYGELLEQIYAKTTGVILYQTVSLGIEAGTPMIAYGELND